MNILLDTNVIIDALLGRKPFEADADAILRLTREDNIRMFISASSVTDVYYIVRRQVADASVAWQKLHDLLRILSVAPIGGKEIYAALNDKWNDFEDAVQSECALSIDAVCIVTRNVQDFAASVVPAITPKEFLRSVSKTL